MNNRSREEGRGANKKAGEGKTNSCGSFLAATVISDLIVVVVVVGLHVVSSFLRQDSRRIGSGHHRVRREEYLCTLRGQRRQEDDEDE